MTGRGTDLYPAKTRFLGPNHCLDKSTSDALQLVRRHSSWSSTAGKLWLAPIRCGERLLIPFVPGACVQQLKDCMGAMCMNRIAQLTQPRNILVVVDIVTIAGPEHALRPIDSRRLHQDRSGSTSSRLFAEPYQALTDISVFPVVEAHLRGGLDDSVSVRQCTNLDG